MQENGGLFNLIPNIYEKVEGIKKIIIYFTSFKNIDGVDMSTHDTRKYIDRVNQEYIKIGLPECEIKLFLNIFTEEFIKITNSLMFLNIMNETGVLRYNN
jgi:hypothetical protein